MLTKLKSRKEGSLLIKVLTILSKLMMSVIFKRQELWKNMDLQ